jgi:hypothetical protein
MPMMVKCKSCGYLQSSTNKSCSWCGISKWSPLEAVLKPATQKAKGLWALEKKWQGITGAVKVLELRKVLTASKELPADISKSLPSFVRPCPPNPEHGFVESRVVKTVEALEALRQETLLANPDSELMFTPVFKEVHNNSIWTPTLLSVGPGNDGATAGKGVVSFPLTGSSSLSEELLLEAGVDPAKAPYVEAIDGYDSNEGHRHWITQLRSGPKLEAGCSIDFIPAEMVVEEIIRTNGEDLLEWAKVIRALKGKSGTVVFHPGGALTDHYSVHCRENGVPIMISHEPAIGEVLEPQPLDPLDPQALIRGLAVGDAMEMSKDSQGGGWIVLCLMALHNSSVLRGQHSFWIGVGAAALIKLGLAAMRGEARHAHQAWKGLTNKPDLYAHYGPKSLSFHRASLSRVTQLLHYGFGDPETQPVKSGCGMGGRRWALCGAALAPVFTSIKRLVDAPTEENASRLLLDYNIAVNQAHNGGWWLNKFITAAAYTEVPAGHLDFLLQASPVILKAGTTQVDVEKFKKAVSYWPAETTIRPLRYRKADLEIQPGALVLKLKASTVPTPKLINIPATPALMKALVDAVGTVDFKPGEINLVTDTGTTTLWKETMLEAVNRQEEVR